MELRQLEYFVAVAEEASFTRAAARVRVAQPGVSAQVRRLERELGLELLDRSGRTVRLTQAGTAVLPWARSTLTSARGVRHVVDELVGLLRGRVAIGMVAAWPAEDVGEAIASFRARHPGVDVTLTERGSDELVAAVRSGELDFAWVGVAADEPLSDLDHFVVADEAVVAAVAPDDPLAVRKRVGLRELANRPVICLPRGAGVRTAFDAACAAAGVTPPVALEASAPPVLARLAARRLGVAIVPESLARARRGEVHALALSPAIRSRVAVVWSAGRASPAASAFIDQIVGER